MSVVMLDLENFIFYYSKTGKFLYDIQTENTCINGNYFRLLRRDDKANSAYKKYSTNVAKVNDVTDWYWWKQM
jgi:hypothetical protein